MFTAKDENRGTVHISTALRQKTEGEYHKYYCPGCGQELSIRRDGPSSCFVHKRRQNCTYGKALTEWYASMLSRFEEKQREIPVTMAFFEWDRNAMDFGFEPEKEYSYQADAIDFSKNTVYMFEEIPLSSEEFKKRQYFFEKAGFRVVWVVNITGYCLDGKLFASRGNTEKTTLYTWDKPIKMFDGSVINSRNISVVLHMCHGLWEKESSDWENKRVFENLGKGFFKKVIWANRSKEEKTIKNFKRFIAVDPEGPIGIGT